MAWPAVWNDDNGMRAYGKAINTMSHTKLHIQLAFSIQLNVNLHVPIYNLIKLFTVHNFSKPTKMAELKRVQKKCFSYKRGIFANYIIV